MRDRFLLQKVFELELLKEEADRQKVIVRQMIRENELTIIDTEQSEIDKRFTYRNKEGRTFEAIYMLAMAMATVKGTFRKWFLPEGIIK